MYGLNSSGMAFPGSSLEVKSYLWKSICAPTLVYGMDSIYVKPSQINKLESVQGNCIKQSLGLSKRSRTTPIISAMNVSKIENVIKNSSASLFHRICKVESPTRTLSSYLLAEYLCNGTLSDGSLLHRMIRFGISPVECILRKTKHKSSGVSDGVIDSLKYLLCHEQFLKPYSDEHLLAHLLVKAF